MIHVVTVHWEDERWIDVQLRYLDANIGDPFRVYAFLNGIPDEQRAKFFYSSTEPIRSHPVKLDMLAEVVADRADPQDWIIFIDGDAFPVSDIVPFGRDKLREFPLVAIQRKENAGDRQPHPSFCLTTVDFWTSIRGNWGQERGWTNDRGEVVHDVGGNLLAVLEERETPWYPMLRSNAVDLHPVFFGVYEDLVYHHGAGFRETWTRADTARVAERHRLLWPILPKRLRPLITRSAARRNDRNSAQIFHELSENPNFYRRFIAG